jgi:putative transposase
MLELLLGLAEYFVFYNSERPHQSLSYKTPDHGYLTREGGARIVEHFSDKQDSSTEEMGQRQSAVIETTPS